MAQRSKIIQKVTAACLLLFSSSILYITEVYRVSISDYFLIDLLDGNIM